ncbi:serine hydrolase domain-containing protein [Sorangium sp. So ce1024]|uniref:serine hydrolase domain-containing protein n=1 Tax=Sorangium sp. So ce1024 TaxID=3133327 RepID=UPI003F06AE2C
MISVHHHIISPTTRLAGAAATRWRGLATVLVSALLGSSALLAGCSGDNGAPASPAIGSDVGGSGGDETGLGGGGGEDGVGGSGGEDEGGGGAGNPQGACVGSTEVANTDPDDPVQQAADHLVRDLEFPAVLVAVQDVDGETRHYTAGVADLETQAKVPVDGQVRIGSNTKPFTAVVVLQLVGEGKVDLDAPIETYLPGLIRGDGIDGNDITVRQLLQHTSGLPDFVGALLGGDLARALRTYVDPRTLLDLALAQEASFPPGDQWGYSNTNYIVAGLLIEKVTGRPLAEEVTERIIERLGLRHTYVPGVGDLSIRECHPRGYHADGFGEPLYDVTELDPSIAGASGDIISTPSDLNRFFSALLGGELLAPPELEQMRATVDASGMWPGYAYGLGLSSTPLRCGGVVWGHGGDIFGYETAGGVTEDGRAVTVAVTALPSAVPGVETIEQAYAAYTDVLAVVDTALCD